jgi:pyruvate dehydrogenase E1 component alpha subunit
MFTATDLINFETEVAEHFAAGEIRSPVHFSGGNEAQLIKIFQQIKPTDYVCSNWRNHYHALLHGIPRERVLADILAGKSMTLNYPEYKFLTSAIVGGTLPIACGLAAGGERVWCFVGDMVYSLGVFADAANYADGHDLPVTFIVEDNHLATNTPTEACWGELQAHRKSKRVLYYQYERVYPHVGLEQRVVF